MGENGAAPPAGATPGKTRKVIRRRTPAIISASRLTDIPRYYTPWLANRLKAGYAESGNAFGGRYWISLQKQDVLAWLFWTRDARPALPLIQSLLDGGAPVAIQFTVTAYGKDLEDDRVPLSDQIASFKAAAGLLPGPTAIQLRYDPILVGGPYTEDWHVAALEDICQQLEGYTVVMNTSLCEPYVKVVQRLSKHLPFSLSYRQADPERHRSTVRKFPGLPDLGSSTSLIGSLADTASRHGMELRFCANPDVAAATGVPRSACCSPELFSQYPPELTARLRSVPAGPSRQGCGCLSTADVGMSDTCPAGCGYCYVTGSIAKSRNFHRRHDPLAPSIRP